MKLKFNGFLVLLVLIAQLTFSQERVVTGVVSDNTGLPLPGATVLIKGTKTATQTDFDGKYSIKATPTQTLIFSYIGMKNEEISASVAKINVKLGSSTVELDGVVVTALGIKRKPKNLGYSVSSIKSTDITENSEPDLIRSINGKVAGVNVNVATGVAGSASQITIRGISTFSGDTQPLIVVDGIIYNNTSVTSSNQSSGGGGYETALSTLDPNDIATVNVLKSAAAAALYGSRAANGVIVITTKSGSLLTKKANKLSVNVGSGTYFENIANLPDYQNKYGAGSNFKYGEGSNGSWGPAFGKAGSAYSLNDDGTINTWATVLAVAPELGPTVPYVAKPNNVKDLFRTGIVNDNTIGFNYSGQDGSFNTTISKLDQNGYIPYNTYDRTSISTGGTFKLSNKLTVGGNMSFSRTNQVGGFFGENQSTSSAASSSFARTLYIARNWDLNLPFEDANGASVTPNGNQFDHPLWSWKHDKINTNTTRTIAGVNLSYKINENISTSYRFGYNNYLLDRKQVRDLKSRADGGLGSLLTDRFNNQDIESTLLINFNYKLSENLGLIANLGNNILQTNTSRIAYYGNEFIVPNIFTMRNVKNVTNSIDVGDRYRNVGIFADITFSYKDYLFINVTGRNDFSSSLPVKNNSYFYPSISGSFILTDAFKLNSTVLTFAKLRAAYARVGSDASPEFLATSYVLSDTFNGQPTASNSIILGDQLITPEFTTEYEVGTELEFFKKRISLDLSLYNKTTTNLITEVKTPPTSGYEIYNTNVGEMNNKGIEIGLNLVPIKTNSFKWSLFTTFTKNKNKVIKISDSLDRYGIPDEVGSVIPETSEQVGYVITGQPFGTFFGTRFARDSQGNYLIDPSSGGILADVTPGIIGDPNADFKMSFINTITYKNLSLRTQFDWKQGGDIKSTTVESLLGRGVTRDTEDREGLYIIPGYYGNVDGTPILDANGAQIPNSTQITLNDMYFSPGTNGNTFAINSVDEATIYDGTVYRLREASLTYDVPTKFLEKTAFGKISLSIIGNNLWYFAPNVPRYTNFDPDVTSFGSSSLQGIEITSAPTSKRIGFKINLTF
jgi:TonB-linked SusC/RagA family outer membrane protein